MKVLVRMLSVLAAVVFVAAQAHATRLPRAFLDGINSYKAQDYDAAVAEFSKIADSGIQNGKLFYNLGNAHLKRNDIGRAVLWYERALKLMPDDPDLKFNHQYAMSLVKDENEDARAPLLRVLFFWQDLLSEADVQHAALVLNAVFWILLSLQAIVRRRILKWPVRGVMVLALVLASTALYNFYAAGHLKRAVILSEKVSVRSGLTEDSTELFTLHAGTTVKIDKENREFCRIFFSDGKIGWLKKNKVGVI